MHRVAIVGSGGAGKSTLARELGRRTGLPVIHLDEHFWKPGWVETPRDEWRALQSDLLAGDAWIADGNYGGTFDVRFALADTVIVLGLAPARCVAGALRRQLTNHGQSIQGPGCPEHVDLAFLRWIWRYPKDSRPRLDAALAEHGAHLDVVELRTRREVTNYVNTATPR